MRQYRITKTDEGYMVTGSGRFKPQSFRCENDAEAYVAGRLGRHLLKEHTEPAPLVAKADLANGWKFARRIPFMPREPWSTWWTVLGVLKYRGIYPVEIAYNPNDRFTPWCVHRGAGTYAATAEELRAYCFGRGWLRKEDVYAN